MKSIAKNVVGLKKDKRRIPAGPYCHSMYGKGFRPGVCPYWSLRKDKPDQANGYCSYLERGDWDMNKEKKWTRVYNKKKGGRIPKSKQIERSAEEIGLPMSLLWDGCKECGVKMESSGVR